MRKAKRAPRIPVAIREQLAHMAHSHNQTLDEVNRLQTELADLRKMYDITAGAFGDLRKQLEDMRRQRDRAVDEAEADRREAAALQRQLDRALGWIDCKTGNTPVFGGGPPYTTEDIMGMMGK